MSGLLSVGTRALQANQVALQTAGHNIANVNTPGYSRQTVVLQTVDGQFTGGGYIGKGVDLQTIQRNFSTFLTRQSALAGTTAAADSTRADKLKQLEGIFDGGSTGLGAAVNDMLNAFSDVASAPTDLTARTVVLTRVDETAARMRAASQRLDDLQQGVSQELGQKVNAVNSLAQSIATVNDQIARTQGSGQSPNDLLDRRDQLIRDLNQYVQTTSIAADDGTVGIFIGGSQALVLGITVAPVSLVADEFGQPKSKLAITRNGQSITLDENTLGGGEVSGLLRFQNTDLVEGRNLLGRLTMAISQSLNDQHKLGLDLNGNPGKDLVTAISPASFTVRSASTNQGASTLTLGISDTSKFAASDYEVNFSSATTGTITRRSDGQVTSFPQTPATTAPILATLDGIDITTGGGAAMAGDRFLLQPFSTAASNIRREFSTPSSLAVASPVAASAGSNNRGTLAVEGLAAKFATLLPNVPLTPVTLTFDGAGNYTRSDTMATAPFTSGLTIESPPDVSPGWSLTLKGAPQAGDTFTVNDSKVLTAAGTMDFKLNAGNASAMMGLRDKAMFDGAALSDGYAGLIAQIGIRTQGANYAAEVSGTIASNLERDRTSVSGVNLVEEAAKLLQFQQAYQASAKMIQIAQGIFDTLIQSLGR
jgi:flagellar hook-associated protein 1 FlgK